MFSVFTQFTPDNSAQHCVDTFGCYEPGFAEGCLHWSLIIFHKLAVGAVHWTICSLRLSVCATWKLGWSKLIFSQLSRNFAMSFVIVICLPKQLLCKCGLQAELLVSPTILQFMPHSSGLTILCRVRGIILLFFHYST